MRNHPKTARVGGDIAKGSMYRSTLMPSSVSIRKYNILQGCSPSDWLLAYLRQFVSDAAGHPRVLHSIGATLWPQAACETQPLTALPLQLPLCLTKGQILQI
jgi:hypothetical protein